MSVLRRLDTTRGHTVLWLLAGILILAGLLRFWGLSAESLWLDEATSLVVADNSPAHIVALTAADIHPPLYYLLLHVWLVFGQSEAAMRSLSAAIGLLSVAALYGLGRDLWGQTAGLLAALLLAVSPLHIWYSQETRMYGLMALWAILSSWLMFRAWERGGWLNWAGYVLVAALGMYTHYYMGFVLLAQNLFVGYLLLRRRVDRETLIHWVVAQLAWIVLFAPWIPTVISQLRGGGGAWVAHAVGRPTPQVLWDTFIGFTIGPVRELIPVWIRRGAYAAYLALLAGAIWIIFRSGKEGEESELAHRWSATDRGVFCLLWCAAPIGIVWLASQVKPMYSLRYLLPFLPPFYLLLAVSVRDLMKRWEAVGLAVIGVLVILNVAGAWMMARTMQKPDWRDLTAQLIEESVEGDVIMPEPFWNAKPLRYYAGGRLVVSDVAPLPATKQGVADALALLARDATRLWLVEDAGHYGDPDRLLAGYLNSRYPLLQVETFAGIGNVALYQLDDVTQ